MYRSTNEQPERRQPRDFDSGWLYSACESIIGHEGGIVVRRESGKFGPLVAFWCDYSRSVKPGYAATDRERQQIANFLMANLSDKQIERELARQLERQVS